MVPFSSSKRKLRIRSSNERFPGRLARLLGTKCSLFRLIPSWPHEMVCIPVQLTEKPSWRRESDPGERKDRHAWS